MDRENKKRGRKEKEEEYPARKEEATKARKKKKQQQQQQQRGGSNAAAIEEEEEKGCVFEASAVEDTCRPRGVFEFPWDDHCGEALDGSDLQDVFFSSLVDGRSAAIGVPGDRLSPPTTSPFALPDEASQPSDADGDADGVDCIWSTVLREPLAVVCTRGFRA
ncbi:hypothetical protein ACMD2_00823 [Ananas comosus]|uniref:Uncharacterized protein n=1 Tax=Ananas comosus TaxID=4615 RepID=A0A199UM45_ANACO|nr:hypothetical protein ACMD2_00823 [Ananas comosus]